MAATRFILAFVCYAAAGSAGQPDGYLLSRASLDRDKILLVAKGQIGVRESTGHNDGPAVEKYLASTGLGKGHPWCAAFVSWVYRSAGFAKPASAWSPDLFPKSRITGQVLPGNVLGIYFPELKRIAHVGLIIKQEGNYLVSVEGNTNITGSREGDGVYQKRRHVRTIYCIADWIAEGRKLP
jgi:hypothetical protein